MFQHIHLHLNERAVLVRNGKAERALGPGRYTFWKRYEVFRWNIDELVFTRCRAIVARGTSASIGTRRSTSRRVSTASSCATSARSKFLRPGIHRVWKVDGNVRLRVLRRDRSAAGAHGRAAQGRSRGRAARGQRRAQPARGPPARRQARARARAGSLRVLGQAQQARDVEVDDLVFWAQPEVLAMLPPTWFATIELGIDAARRRVPRRQADEVPASGCPPRVDDRPERRGRVRSTSPVRRRR